MIRIYLIFLSIFFFGGCGEKDIGHKQKHDVGDLSTNLNKSEQSNDENKNATLAKINLDDPKVRKAIIEQAVEVTSVKKSDGTFVIYEPLARSPYKGTGWVVEYYDNGSLLDLCQLKDGKRDGLGTQWHENGEKKAKVNWKDGKQDGLLTQWHENGQMKEKVNWKDGERDRLRTFWYENGQKQAEESWKDGKRNGLATQWHENGQKKEEANWKDGKRDGLKTFWYENGQKQAEESWKDGNPDDSTVWYENGEMQAKVNWKDGKKDGLETIWYDSGKKEGEGYWKDGKLQRVKKWKPNGEVCPITNVNYGNGISVIYNMDGSEKERFIFKDGEPIKTNEQSNEKTDAGISPEELDKLHENSIGESPPIPVPLPPSP